MTETRLTPAILELKLLGADAKGVFQGYASTWGGPPDAYGDIVRKGAFLNALQAHEAAGTMPAMLWGHNQSEPVGKWLAFEEDAKGLVATGRLTLGIQRGKDALALMADDAIALSIGFILGKNGAEMRGAIREIKDVQRLVEVSLVAVPANTNARITSTKARPTTPRDFERLLRDVAGYSVREAKRLTAKGWGGLVRDEQDSELDLVLAEIQKLRTEINERG